MTSKQPQIPNEYNNDETPMMPVLNGTDIYLSLVSGFLAAHITQTCINLVMIAHEFALGANWIYSMMAITSLLSAHNCLTNRNQRFFRQRVFNAVTSSLNLVFIVPFTIPAQIVQTLTNGFTINRNVFD